MLKSGPPKSGGGGGQQKKSRVSFFCIQTQTNALPFNYCS